MYLQTSTPVIQRRKKIVLVVLLFDDKIKAPRCLLRKFKIICDTHWKNCKIGQLNSGTT